MLGRTILEELQRESGQVEKLTVAINLLDALVSFGKTLRVAVAFGAVKEYEEALDSGLLQLDLAKSVEAIKGPQQELPYTIVDAEFEVIG